MDTEASSSARVLLLLRQAQVVDELLSGSRRLGARVTEHVVTFVENELERLRGRESSITACESLLCGIVMEAITEGPNFVAGCQRPAKYRPQNKEEAPIAAALKRLVFGMDASDERFARVMCSQTYEKAGIALRASVLLLEDAVRPQNCLRILALAASTGSQRLLVRSAAVALLHFRQAVVQDRAGLLILPREVLGILLEHDCVQAGEGDIFSALGLWVMADEEERLQHLYPLTVQCVRLRSMSMKELSSMDQHPLIPKCPSTLKLVAFGYLSACYASSLPEEYAPFLARSRRQRIAINPEALSLISYNGAGLASPERHSQLPGDLFRLWPALQGKPEEASPAPYATLQQLRREGLGEQSDSSALAACSAEGLTHGVSRLLSTQKRKASPLEYSTAQEHFCLEDSARWSSAVPPIPPQHQPGSTFNHISHESSSSMLPEAPQDSMDHDASSDRAHESALGSAAECPAASSGVPRGIQVEASSVDSDIFGTSPSQTCKRTQMDGRQAEAQSAACRQLLKMGKPLPSAKLQRRLF